jgi:hypothetical protein
MRTTIAIITTLLALPAAAQSVARDRPAGTMPLDEPPPPPALVQTDPSLQTQGNAARNDDGDRTREYRANGRVFMERITPSVGAPYVVIHDRGDGTMMPQDNTLDVLRGPQWTLWEF